MSGVDLVKSIFPEWATETMPDFDESIEINIGPKTVCHVGLMKRTIQVDGRSFPVAAIGYVATDPEWRRRGLMKKAMRMAEWRGRELHCCWSLLNAGHQELYHPLGFAAVPNLPSGWMVNHLMTLRPWPTEAVVDLGGTW